MMNIYIKILLLSSLLGYPILLGHINRWWRMVVQFKNINF